MSAARTWRRPSMVGWNRPVGESVTECAEIRAAYPLSRSRLGDGVKAPCERPERPPGEPGLPKGCCPMLPEERAEREPLRAPAGLDESERADCEPERRLRAESTAASRARLLFVGVVSRALGGGRFLRSTTYLSAALSIFSRSDLAVCRGPFARAVDSRSTPTSMIWERAPTKTTSAREISPPQIHPAGWRPGLVSAQIFSGATLGFADGASTPRAPHRRMPRPSVGLGGLGGAAAGGSSRQHRTMCA